LDLFTPHEYGYVFKVIVTNRKIKANQVLVYHNGRSAPLWEFDELDTHAALNRPAGVVNGPGWTESKPMCSSKPGIHPKGTTVLSIRVNQPQPGK